ncbi:MAG: copper amine oxidase N-terminal domain-containing protein [Candidatus Eremiobacteraeota bacterium]|nr:copper amine oxidase N-terminal domain-containing protein [Candidatus Eremiobacteraeota bacterium]
MNRLSTGVLAAVVAAACGLSAAAASPNAPAQANGIAQAGGSMPPANFGSPPSGQIPILFNDHHVYSKPDVLKQGRVLAALVKGGTLLIPLRSMFEQMGATVSYDPASKTATVSKPGSEVKVTVGKPEVVINGESRPLDVPPMIYQGSVLVPVRVISEGMGAYVQWVPDQHVVVVRYLPPTPPPTPAPTPPPATPAPTPTPTPAPVKTPSLELFVAGDYIISPTVYNEFSPGNTGNNSFAARGAVEFSAFNIPWMVEGLFERWQYPHNCNGLIPGSTTQWQPQCYVTTIGSTGQTVVLTTNPPGDNLIEARVGIRVMQPRIYVGAGYLWASNNYGYPEINNVGFGLEKLPDLNQALTFFGSIYYYPNVHGAITTGVKPTAYNLAYNILKYQVGVNYVIGNSPVFIEAGWMGDSWNKNSAAPINRSYNGPFAGLGFKLPI